MDVTGSDGGQSPIIVVPLDRELRDRGDYIENVWRPARYERTLIAGAAWWPDAMTELFEAQGKIAWPDGTPYRIPDIDAVFDCADVRRWILQFLEADATGERPRRFSPILPRLRVIAVFCAYRSLKRHFR